MKSSPSTPTAPDFRVLFESAPGCYLALLPDPPAFTIAAVSDAFLLATMTDRATILGRGFFEAFPDEPVATGLVRASLDRVLSLRRPDAVAVRKDGVRNPEAGSGGVEERRRSRVNSPVFGGDGSIAYILHRIEDSPESAGHEPDRAAEVIRTQAGHVEAETVQQSRRLAEGGEPLRAAQEELARRTEEELQRSRERLDLIQDAARLGLWFCELPLERLTWNHHCKEQFGLPPEAEVTIETFYERLHPEDAERVRAVIDHALRERAVFDAEFRTVGLDGRVRWIHSIGRRFDGPDGEPARFDGITIDITERKQAEEAGRANEAWGRVTLASIGDALIASDPEGRVALVNARAEALTGWTHQEALGRPLREVFRIVHEETREPVEDPVARVFETGAVQGLANHTVPLARDGAECPIDDSAAPIRDDRGHLHGVILIFRDVRERRALERQLRSHAEALEETGRRKDEFLAMLGHELRNPLAPIRTGLYLLQQRPDDAATIERIGAMIDRQVRTLTRIIDDLLDMSRITRGRITLQVDRLDLGRLVREQLDDRRALFERAGLTLGVRVPELPVWVMGDSVRLRQVLGNLLENALKFTDRGGSVAVELSAPEGESTAILTVRDNGIGIEPEMLGRLFETLAQADRSLDRSRGGLGLGLALIKGLVELHGGRVEAMSEGPDQGAEFRVYLVRVEEPAALADRAPSPPRDRKHLRVLVVEDNRDAAESLRSVLELFGYEVDVAYTGPAGVSMAHRAHPDVLVCDIGLPEMDGYAVARALRQDPETAGTRMVAVTGYGQDEDKERARAAGFDVHLTKPVDLMALEEVLGKLTAR